MNDFAAQASAAFLDDLFIHGESVSLMGQSVAATVNREPRLYDMQDAGYIDREPITIEVLQGITGSQDVVSINGVDTPQDMRGIAPIINGRAVVDNLNRKIVKVVNAVDRWIVTTIKLNIHD